MDWIIVGIIVALTIFIIVRSVVRLKRGKGGCDCSGCDPAKRSCMSDRN